jgi:hypothetical protein
MKCRFNVLYNAYQQATGQDPPEWDPAAEVLDGPGSYPKVQKNARSLQHLEPVTVHHLQNSLKKTNTPNWGSLDPSKFTVSQEEAMMQAESQNRSSPVRQRRTSRAGRTDTGPPPVHSEKPKTIIFPPPPVLNLAGATIMVPGPSSSVQSNQRGRANVTSGRSPKKAARSSIAHLLVQAEHPTFISNSHAPTSTSHQAPPTLLPAAQINEDHQYHGSKQARTATAPKTSSANHSGRHQSAIVHKHAKNIEQRRKQAEDYTQADARRAARAQAYNEQRWARKTEYRAFLDRRSKELQVDMGVDLGDFPPDGQPPQKFRWKTIRVGPTQYAPRYVTPEPVVKTEEEEVPLNEDEPQGGADQHDEQGSGHANPPRNEDYDRDDEGEEELYHDEIAGDGDRYYEAPIPSQEGSQFDPEDDAPAHTHRAFLQGDTRYRYHDVVAESPAIATNGSSGSRKSKHGERQETTTEEIVTEVQEARPTKRRRMAANDPVPGPSDHPNALAGSSNHPNALAGPSDHPTALTAEHPTINRPSAQNEAPRRASTRLRERQRAKNIAEAKRLKGIPQYLHDPGPVPRRGQDNKVPKGANGTKEDLLSRQADLHRVYLYDANGNHEVPELGVATEFRKDDYDSDLDNDPIAGQLAVRVDHHTPCIVSTDFYSQPLKEPAFPEPDFRYWPQHPGSRPGSPRPESPTLAPF